MRVRSSDSVTIISLEAEAILQRLREAARSLIKQRDEVGSVWLFGSLAKGQAVPGSDADILVVLKEATRSPQDRLTEYVGAFAGVGVPAEVLAYTHDEIDAMRAEGNFLIHSILEDRLQLA
jgi:predicted nucleotidyltransferase